MDCGPSWTRRTQPYVANIGVQNPHGPKHIDHPLFFFLDDFVSVCSDPGDPGDPLHAPHRIIDWPRSRAAREQEKHLLALQKMQLPPIEPSISVWSDTTRALQSLHFALHPGPTRKQLTPSWLKRDDPWMKRAVVAFTAESIADLFK